MATVGGKPSVNAFVADDRSLTFAQHGVPRSNPAVNQTAEARQRELVKIQGYRDLVGLVGRKRHDNDYSEESLATASELLMKNPEYYSIWNYRRQILLALFTQAEETSSRVGDLIRSDLDFLIPLLKKFPKCYWIWNHRLWLLEQATQKIPRPEARKLWQYEHALVGKMLSLDSRNFHGWGYRRKVVAALESMTVDAEEGGQDVQVQARMSQAELDYTTRMIGTNLSNFSAWHNRSQLILKRLAELSASDDERKNMLNEELKLIHRALIDPYDQSLWFYHQNLMCTFDPVRAPKTMAPNLGDSERIEYLCREVEAIKELLDEEADCKWIYQALIECTMLVAKIEGMSSNEVKQDVRQWAAKLKRLDPLRRGRWEDLEASFVARTFT